MGLSVEHRSYSGREKEMPGTLLSRTREHSEISPAVELGTQLWVLKHRHRAPPKTPTPLTSIRRMEQIAQLEQVSRVTLLRHSYRRMILSQRSLFRPLCRRRNKLNPRNWVGGLCVAKMGNDDAYNRLYIVIILSPFSIMIILALVQIFLRGIYIFK